MSYNLDEDEARKKCREHINAFLEHLKKTLPLHKESADIIFKAAKEDTQLDDRSKEAIINFIESYYAIHRDLIIAETFIKELVGFIGLDDSWDDLEENSG